MSGIVAAGAAMGSFDQAFDVMIKNEGGFVLHTVPGDRGGMTYAGIARNMNPQWPGWAHIDRGETPPTDLVREFYRREFWNPLCCDDMPHRTAEAIFDFAVNAGRRVAVKLAQIVVGAQPDGAVGPKTLAAIQGADPEKFVLAYALAKITRYRDIVTRDRSQAKFLLGWINRTLKGVA